MSKQRGRMPSARALAKGFAKKPDSGSTEPPDPGGVTMDTAMAMIRQAARPETDKVPTRRKRPRKD